jgi:NAD(P)-dependent dehydrogenase (short-subunit alcohol dehydrogenase family)
MLPDSSELLLASNPPPKRSSKALTCVRNAPSSLVAHPASGLRPPEPSRGRARGDARRRDLAAGERAAADITRATGNARIQVAQLELVDRASIEAFVANWKGPLDILVNNAGVMAIPELQFSAPGHELQFATNHLGHFALSIGLHDALAAAGRARIVSVSSSGHLLSPVVFDDIDFAFRQYDPWAAYGQSKTANVLFAVGANTRWAKTALPPTR